MKKKKSTDEYNAQIHFVTYLSSIIHGHIVSEKAFTNFSRTTGLINVKQAGWYFMSKVLIIPQQVIADYFEMNHATIYSGVNNIVDAIDVNDKAFIEKYITPLHEAYKKYNGTKVLEKRFMALAIKWEKMNLYEEFKLLTENMEEKAYNLMKLIRQVETDGFTVTRNPDMIYVSEGLDDSELSEEIRILRKTHGFIVQTEMYGFIN